MELRDIEYFAVIAEHGHLGRAAEALGISQPALSKSLGRLETAVGAKLVQRMPKGVELTAEGAALQRRVSDLRLSLQSVTREIKDVNEGRVGQLRMGVGAQISERFLSAAFAKLLDNAPLTTLKITVSDNDVMIPALKNGELDLIVNYGWLRAPHGIVFERLYDIESVVCAATGHRLSRQARVTVQDVANERWAWAEPSLLPQQKLREAFRDASLPPPQPGLECRSTALLLRAVAQSDLLTIVSESFVRHVPDAKLKILPVKELSWRREVGFIRRDENYLSPVVQRLIHILKSFANNAATM